MSPDGQLFAIHCTVNKQAGVLDAAIIVVEPVCSAGWVQMVVPQIYGGDSFRVRLPVDLVGRDSRYKGYNVRLPILTATP
jgi:hypothetical protein